MLDSVAFKTKGAFGALGNVDGSGLLCSVAVPVVSTLREADQELSPLSEDAVHVNRPESSG